MNEVLNCLETRRSCRAYRPEQIPEAVLQEILQAGLYAPSAMEAGNDCGMNSMA